MSEDLRITILTLQYTNKLIKSEDFGFRFKIYNQKYVFEVPPPHGRSARIQRGF